MKKGQLDYPIITFFVLVIGLLILAPVVLKIFNSVQDTISPQLANLSGGQIAQANFDKVMNTATGFWDKVIVACFFIGIILLTVSAIFIDTSPFFVIIYIFISFVLVLFAPDIVSSLSAIYDSPTFSEESNNLSFMNSLITYFGEILVGIIIFTGIIIYGKISLFKGGNGERR